MPMARLNGVRVLLVEDDALIALTIEDTLSNAGCRVVGPLASVGAALRAIEEEPPQCAVLDVNLGGELALPIADALAAAAIPFIWLTGHSAETLPAPYRHHPVVCKPYLDAALMAALSAAVGREA
jgi:DNA-binding response OmpR family regulator